MNHRIVLAAFVLLTGGMLALAQDASTEKKSDHAAPSAADVEKDLESLIQDNPAIESADPNAPKGTKDEDLLRPIPPSNVESDPRVLGTAPGLSQPKLLREGEFVVSRRGRLERSSNTGTSLFVFDADDADSPEHPMGLMPCQLLQSMESLVAERGEKIVFIISGQVFTYRGANYLLPTTMKLAVDKGNLKQGSGE